MSDWTCGCDNPDIRDVDHGDNPDGLPEEKVCTTCLAGSRDGIPVW